MDGEHYRQLETRINISERSNRALLEEVVRLQGEMKASIRRNDDLVRAEQQSRQQIEHSLRTSNELVSQLSARLKRTEDKVQDERSNMMALMNQHKSVEQAVLGGQQELISRRDLQSSKLVYLCYDIYMLFIQLFNYDFTNVFQCRKAMYFTFKQNYYIKAYNLHMIRLKHIKSALCIITFGDFLIYVISLPEPYLHLYL